MLLGVDVGGTFTDAVAVTRRGVVHTAKVPSTRENESLGVVAAIEEVLKRADAQAADVERLAHGMTVATNALLEGRTARTALIATESVTDVVELGRQARAHLYRLCERGPEPLTPPRRRYGAPERMGPEGVWRELDPQAARDLIARVAQARPEAVAVVLLHSYADATHEQLLGALLGELMPDTHVSLSSELVGTFREYERAATTEVDAALSPLLAGYLKHLTSEAARMGLREPEIMQSSGGLMEAERAARHAALTVLSGPAGGVGGARLLAERAGEPDVVCFDMGGTSCDVCVIEAGRVAETAERKVAGRPLALPALDIQTVGAGGGSIAWRDAGGALRVGPASAGAEPGPACYGRGGSEATVTDANLLLGRLLDDAPLAGGIRLSREAAERAVAKLAAELGLSRMACAEGIVRVAEAEMARALRVMTVERGVDPRAMALMPFGGAGGLHAAALAGELSMRRLLCPRASGVLSALGLAAAAPRRDAARTVLLRGRSLSSERVTAERDELLDRARAELGGSALRGGGRGRGERGARQGEGELRDDAQGRATRGRLERDGKGEPEDEARLRVVYEMRYAGQSFELGVQASPVGEADADALRELFAFRHEERYGYRDDEAEVELVTIRASAWGEAPELELASAGGAEPRRERREVIFKGETLEAECMRGELPPGTRVSGPAICAQAEATLWVPPGWSGEVDEQGSVRLDAQANESLTTGGTPLS
jgi:N-methylhydantoinase A